jgi:hypothetical protein
MKARNWGQLKIKFNEDGVIIEARRLQENSNPTKFDEKCIRFKPV